MRALRKLTAAKQGRAGLLWWYASFGAWGVWLVVVTIVAVGKAGMQSSPSTEAVVR